MRKLLLIICFLPLVMSMACIYALAEEISFDLKESDGFSYIIKEDGTAEICSWNNYISGIFDLSIPESLDGYQVTSINPQANFSGAETYTISIPDCLTDIPKNPFSEIYDLTRIDVSPDHPTMASIDGVLYSKADKRLISYPRAMENTTFQVPDGVRTIGDYAFIYSSNLQSIELPNSLEVIGAHAFENCDLLDVTLPESLRVVGDYAFSFSHQLQTVTMQCIGIQIGECAFQPCGSLRAFYASPDDPLLASIDGVLYNKVEKCLIDFPAGNGLQSFSVPEGIQTIGSRAFAFCYDLFMVELPQSCTSIQKEAFISCESLNSIEFPRTLTSIGDYAFDGCDFSQVRIPESVIEVGANPFINCYRLSKVEVSPESENLATIENVLFDKQSKKLICYPWELPSDSYQIPDGILEIGDSAFPGSGYLDLVEIPDTVAVIEENALSELYCKIRVTRDSYAAQYCKEHNLDYEYTDATSWLNS